MEFPDFRKGVPDLFRICDVEHHCASADLFCDLPGSFGVVCAVDNHLHSRSGKFPAELFSESLGASCDQNRFSFDIHFQHLLTLTSR